MHDRLKAFCAGFGWMYETESACMGLFGSRLCEYCRSSLIAGLWTGSLDWTAGVGVTFELKLCVSHVQCLAASRLPRSRTQHAATMGVLCLRDLKGMQQMEQLGRPIGTIIYSKASHWPSIVFTWLHSTRLRLLHSLVTSVGFNLTAAFSSTLQQYIVLVKRHLSVFLMLFCTLDIVRGCFAELMHFM